MSGVSIEALLEILEHASSSDETASGSQSLDYAADLMDDHGFTQRQRDAVWLLAEGIRNDR